MRTALHIAEKEKPLNDFGKLIKLQRENGTKMLKGKDSDKICGSLLDCIELALEQTLQHIMSCVDFYSILFDGSDAAKILWNKELVYAKVFVQGHPRELLLQLVHMRDFGGENSDSLKKAIDSVLKKYNLLTEEKKCRLVALCCDGASVNMGHKKGASEQIKQDERP